MHIGSTFPPYRSAFVTQGSCSMKRELWIAAFIAVLALVSGCSKGRAQNSTDMRALNAVVDAEPLDVLVADSVKASALALGTTSSYSEFSSGTLDVKVRSSTSQNVLSEKSLAFTSGTNTTLLMYGKRNAVLTTLLADDATSPASGNFRVRFVNLASDSGPVDLYLTTGDISSAAPLISATSYGSVTNIAEAVAGSFRITFTAAGTQDILFQSTAQTFSANADVTVVVVPSLGGKLVNAVMLPQGLSTSGTLLQNPLARLKAVNALPDSTAVNFKADATTLLSSVPFAGSSSYVTTAAGSRALQLEAANVPGVTIATLARQLDPARDYSVIAVGSISAPQLVSFSDDNSLPATGFAKLRFVNGLAGSTTVDVLVNFASQTSQLAFGTASSYYQLAPSLTYTITFSSPGGVSVISTLTPAELDAAGVYTAYLVGTQAAPQTRLVRDR
jgi:hypothetical protein